MARILIVDENESHIDLVKEALLQYKNEYVSEWRLAIDTARTLSHGMDLVKRHNYEMIIADILLANTNSWDFLKTVRNRFPQILKTPVVILSEVSAIDLEYQAIRYGASAWFTKFPPIQHFAREIFKLLQGA
jgi:DNA-binding NarL/FixJ family response regulator